MQLIIVVLPVPGPPVMTSNPCCAAMEMAFFCVGEDEMPLAFSKLRICASTVPSMMVCDAACKSRRRRAISAFRLPQLGQKNALHAVHHMRAQLAGQQQRRQVRLQ